MTEAEQIAAFIAEHGVKRLPRRVATAPPIAKIRQAIKAGQPITFTRGRSGRTVTFNATSNPGTVDAETPVHDEGGGRMRRRRNKRSPNRNQRQR
jgi:hypothetical protein